MFWKDGTSNKSSDGLFNIGASYSLGFGSKYGAGYVIEVRLATLEHIPDELRTEIESNVVGQLERELPEVFPDRKLSVEKDGSVYKIIGDFNLGEI